MSPGGRSPEDLWRPRAHSRGFVAAAFGGLLGAVTCGTVGGLGVAAALDLSSDASPEVFLAPLVIGLLGGMWLGCVLGCYLVLRVRKFAGAGHTSLWTGIVLLPAMIVVWVGLDPVPLWTLVIGVTVGSTLIGRAIARSSPLRASA